MDERENTGMLREYTLFNTVISLAIIAANQVLLFRANSIS